MRMLLPVFFGLALFAVATAPPARADVYVGVGVGTGYAHPYAAPYPCAPYPYYRPYYAYRPYYCRPPYTYRAYPYRHAPRVYAGYGYGYRRTYYGGPRERAVRYWGVRR